MIVNKKQFEDITGYSTPQVRAWLRDGMPHTIVKGHGKAGMNYKIDSQEAIQWLLRRSRTTGKKIPASEKVQLQREKALALDNAVRAGELLEYDKVEHAFSEIISGLANELEGLPGRLANELAGLSDPGRIRLRLLEECRRIRRNTAAGLHQQAESISPSEAGSEADDPAADPPRERVGRRKARITPRKRRAR